MIGFINRCNTCGNPVENCECDDSNDPDFQTDDDDYVADSEDNE